MRRQGISLSALGGRVMKAVGGGTNDVRNVKEKLKNANDAD